MDTSEHLSLHDKQIASIRAQAEAAIDAIYRHPQLAPALKLDILESIQRHAGKQDAKVRAAIRKAKKK